MGAPLVGRERLSDPRFAAKPLLAMEQHLGRKFRAVMSVEIGGTNGRLCMTNNAAERALRGIAVGRHNWTFAGSDAGGHRAAAIYTLIETAKLNDVDPQAWLTDMLTRLQDHPARRVDELMPWN